MPKNVTVFGNKDFQGATKANQVIRVRPSSNLTVVLIRRDARRSAQKENAM